MVDYASDTATELLLPKLIKEGNENDILDFTHSYSDL